MSIGHISVSEPTAKLSAIIRCGQMSSFWVWSSKLLWTAIWMVSGSVCFSSWAVKEPRMISPDTENCSLDPCHFRGIVPKFLLGWRVAKQGLWSPSPEFSPWADYMPGQKQLTCSLHSMLQLSCSGSSAIWVMKEPRVILWTKSLPDSPCSRVCSCISYH